MGLISRHMRQIIISQSCHSFLPQDLCSCCLPCWECPSLGSSCHSGLSSQGVTSLENVLDHPLKCSPSSIKNYLMCFIFILFSSPLVQNVTFRRARILTRVKHEPSGGSDGLESITLVSSHWTTPCHSMPTPAYQAPRRDIFSSLLSPQPGHLSFIIWPFTPPVIAGSLCSFKMVQSTYRTTPEGSTVLGTRTDEPQILPHRSRHPHVRPTCWSAGIYREEKKAVPDFATVSVFLSLQDLGG